MKTNKFAMAGVLFLLTFAIMVAGLGIINFPSLAWKYNIPLTPEYKMANVLFPTQPHTYMNQDLALIGMAAVGSGLALMLVLFLIVVSSSQLTTAEKLLAESKALDTFSSEDLEKGLPDRF